MISKVTVFHRGGAVLWTSDDDATASPGDSGAVSDAPSSAEAMQFAVNRLIQSVLLSDKSASDSMVHDAFTLKWSFANNLNLVFVAVFYSFQKLLYVDDFLEMVKREFVKMFAFSVKGGVSNLTQQDYSAFLAQYKRIQKYFQTNRSSKAPKKWTETNRGKEHQRYKVQDRKQADKSSSSTAAADDDEGDDDDASSNSSVSLRIRPQIRIFRTSKCCFNVVSMGMTETVSNSGEKSNCFRGEHVRFSTF